MKKFIISLLTILALCIPIGNSSASVSIGKKPLINHHVHVIKGHFFTVFEAVSKENKELIIKSIFVLEHLHKDKKHHDLLKRQDEREVQIILVAVLHIRGVLNGKYPGMYPENALELWEHLGKNVIIKKVNKNWTMQLKIPKDMKRKKKEQHKENATEGDNLNDYWRKEH